MRSIRQYAPALCTASQRVSDAIVSNETIISELDDASISALSSFFTLLDTWDREEKHEC